MSLVGRLIRRSLFPPGSLATIRRGPLRGCRYRVTEESGWAPILGRWEPEAQAAYVKLLRPGDVVWDLGANTGIHTLLFARLVQPSGQVIAFEPLRRNVELIRETCSLNGVGNVTVVEKAVSDTVGRAPFHLGQDDKQGSLVGIGCEDGQTVQVSCTTLDAERRELPAPDFVKIDIEGAESRALRGFSKVDDSHPTFAIDLHTPTEDLAVGSWLCDHGYSLFRLVDATARAKGVRARKFEPIRDPASGWPVRDGVWGTVVAVHLSRVEARAILDRAAD